MSTDTKPKRGPPFKDRAELRVSYTRRYLPEHLAKIKAAESAEFDALLDAWKPRTKKPAK
ncbi:MAG TPA: hypothetical protein VGE36_13765 [Roseateles sp.]